MEVKSSIPFGARFERLNGFALKLTTMVQQYGVTIDPYQVTTILLQTDPGLAQPIKPARFIFERRANVPYSGDLFYSEAPVSTEQHMELLEELERSL
jgi:hypothetical protein